MKKIAILILAVLYITITSGVVMNMHYCMGNFSSVTYGFDKQDGCGKCGMKQNNSCCHSEYKIVKLQDVHLLTAAPDPLASQDIVIPADQEYFSSIVLASEEPAYTRYHSPPDKRRNTLYLYNSVFRI